MPGGTNLAALLRAMQPVLHPDEFVFCTSPNPPVPEAVCVFREHEGITLICRREDAERHGLACTFPCRMITLDVHSSLEAVGFLAEIASVLARRGIGVNVVSAYYHDHLFVAAPEAERALAALREFEHAAQL